MNNTAAARIALLLTLAALAPLAAQTESVTIPDSVSTLRVFSPLGEIYVHSLGMADRNRNGAIDQGAGEGYEECIAHYGNADTGFTANAVIYGTANGRLEEPEIVNHYYLHIRFKHPVETETIEREVRSYIYDNDIPLVWLDDEQGTVMKAVNGILGEGWNQRDVTEDEAVRMFNRTMGELRIRGRTGNPDRNGYYTLPEFVTNRAGYCFEVAAFGFFFFSELRLNAVTLRAALTNSVLHEIVELTDSERKIDYFGSSTRYRNLQWSIINPLQSLNTYYIVLGKLTRELTWFEKALIYDRYSIVSWGRVMTYHFNNTDNYNTVITLGELFLGQNDMDVTRLITTRQNDAALKKEQVKIILLTMYVSYVLTRNHGGYSSLREMLIRHYRTDREIQRYLKYYTLG